MIFSTKIVFRDSCSLFTFNSKLTEDQINKAYCEVGFKDGDVNEFTLGDIDDDVFTPENKINIKVTFKYTEYGDDSQVNIDGDEIEEEE